MLENYTKEEYLYSSVFNLCKNKQSNKDNQPPCSESSSRTRESKWETQKAT